MTADTQHTPSTANSTETDEPHAAASDATLDAEEVRRFSKLAAEWWDPLGNFRPLHQIGPPRLSFIRNAAVAHFNRDATARRPLDGLTALDIGCGGGLVSEPLSRMGATVTGIDPAERNIAIARAHSLEQGLTIDYQPVRVEQLADQGARFDIVACLEVVEHVPDVAAFITACSTVVKPGGIAVFSTLNRTFKSWALGIVAAEYVLGWLPRGTHQWDRFVTPDEIRRYTESAGLQDSAFAGIVYSPLKDAWSLATDTEVNYLVSVRKPA